MITDYKVVRCRDIEDLATEINRLIQEGYEPQGGVSFLNREGFGFVYVQAMIKTIVF